MGAKKFETDKIGYSFIFDHQLDSMLDSVNRMINANINRLPGVDKVVVEDPDDGKSLEVTFIKKNGGRIKKVLKRYVDEGAIELTSTSLEAFWGFSRNEAKETEEILSSPGRIKKLAPHIYRQLRREYILSTMPHDNGGEFTEQDEIELCELAGIKRKRN